MTYSATYEEIAKLILQANGADGEVAKIYIKDGKVNVEMEESK